MATKKTILLPGGLGYIGITELTEVRSFSNLGSHTIVVLLQNTPHNIVVVDDFSNSGRDVPARLLKTINEQCKKTFTNRVTIHEANILDLPRLEAIFKLQIAAQRPITSVIHFAAKKSVNESIKFPLLYYENNFIGSMNILKCMEKFKDCKYKFLYLGIVRSKYRDFIFSSTAAIYGQQNNCTEEAVCVPNTPYGESKLCVQMALRSLTKQHPDWRVISLRYFNPVGNHMSGEIGDWPTSEFPTNLFPVIEQVIMGIKQKLDVFGSDYNTKDGTPVRDYIHVVDLGIDPLSVGTTRQTYLAQAHLVALEYCTTMKKNYDVFNLGTGHGYTVLQVLKQFEKSMNGSVNYQLAPRRAGDLQCLVAAVGKAEKELGWKAKKTLQQMCESCLQFVKLQTLQNQKK